MDEHTQPPEKPVIEPEMVPGMVPETAKEPETVKEPETAPETETAAPQLVASAEIPGLDAETEIRRMSRRSFLWAAVASAGTYAGFRWMNTRRLDNGIPWPLRRVLDVNGEIAQDYFSTARLAPTFPKFRAREPRANGQYGLGDDFDPKTWNLEVMGLSTGQPLQLSLSQIKALPRVEITTELKCIEGWAVIVTWAGARFLDFLKKYPPDTQSGFDPEVEKKPEDLLPYISAKTPDGEYFVGLEMACALHPQTLLCYEMNGKPLALEHGAPLRLVTPTKYGIKHLKRLGSLEFTAQKPSDYWAEQGYDWYAGH